MCIADLGKFADYILKTYIESSSFPPSLWAAASTDFTTTNGVESYNSKLQGEFYYHHPHAPTAVQQIFDAQSIISLKIKSVRAGETFQPRKAQRILAADIQANIDLYIQKKMGILQFLKAVRDVKYPKTQDPTDEVDDPESANESEQDSS